MPEKSRVGKKKNPAAVALGRLGGLKGGRVTAARRSKEEQARISSKAGKARAKKLSAAKRKQIARLRDRGSNPKSSS